MLSVPRGLWDCFRVSPECPHRCSSVVSPARVSNAPGQPGGWMSLKLSKYPFRKLQASPTPYPFSSQCWILTCQSKDSSLQQGPSCAQSWSQSPVSQGPLIPLDLLAQDDPNPSRGLGVLCSLSLSHCPPLVHGLGGGCLRGFFCFLLPAIGPGLFNNSPCQGSRCNHVALFSHTHMPAPCEGSVNTNSLHSFFLKKVYVFYFWLFWVFVAAYGLFLVVASGRGENLVAVCGLLIAVASLAGEHMP